MYVYGQLTAREKKALRNRCRSHTEPIFLTTKPAENGHGCDADDSHSADTLFDTEEFMTIRHGKGIAQLPENVEVETPCNQCEEEH